MTKGPIVIVDDDEDDLEIYAEGIREMGVPNEIKLFDTCQTALNYLSSTSDQPFIILSDINMPQMNGLEFKRKIQEDEYLQSKGIPFIFISTNVDKKAVREAHTLSVQGYFLKPHRIDDVGSMLRKLFDYWELCKHVNNT